MPSARFFRRLPRSSTRTPDGLGRLQKIETKRGAAVVEAHAWSYNAAGQRERDTLADGSYWAYGYNGRGK